MKARKIRKRKYMYGKFHHDTFEFCRELHELFNSYLSTGLSRYNLASEKQMSINNEIIDLRNQVVALFKSWIGSKKIEQKFGIRIPFHSKPPSIASFLEKQGRSSVGKYRPCEICGEDRITNFSHILPHSEGGPDDPENYVYLCPTHHHLFDHNRLSKEEWEKLDFSKKMEAAREYAHKIRLPILKKFWES